MLKQLTQYIKEYKKEAIQSVIFTCMEAILSILIPYVMASIIDQGINKGDMGSIFKYGIIMVVFSLISFTLGVTAGLKSSKASSGFAANLRSAMFAKIQEYSFANIDKYSTGGLITRLTTDVNNIQMAFQMLMRMCIRAPFILITALFMALITNFRISLIFLGCILVVAFALIFIAKRAMKTFTQVFKKYDKLNESIEENTIAIRVVKSFVREDYEIDKFNTAIDDLFRNFKKAEYIISFNAPVMSFVSYGCILLLSWFGAHFIVEATLTTGQLTSMFSYVSNVFMSLMMLSMVFVMLTMSIASGERICEVLNEVPDISNPKHPLYEVKDGSIDFDDVDFTYKTGSGRYALKDIELHIASGETIGIIGTTGSAKSSLVNLVSRLYDVSQGSVRVGGEDVRKYDLTTLRDNVAVVLQTNTLFSGTIADNLRWGDNDATDEEIRHAAELSGALEFVLARPEGFDTWVEQGGTNVSGGQKQRLCIARALLKKPKVLILDDSTSAVDTATEAKIRDALMNNIPDVTKLIIAQRISSVKDADRIIVMDGGRINGFDTHDNLLKTNEIYKSIYEVQVEGNADFDH